MRRSEKHCDISKKGMIVAMNVIQEKLPMNEMGLPGCDNNHDEMQ